MRHFFLIDPLERLQVDTDTTIAFMREAQARGHEIFTGGIDTLGVRDGGRPYAGAIRTRTTEGPEWYAVEGQEVTSFLDGFDIVWMRKDPPFDMRFFYATHLLSLVEPPTLVVNDPLALRDANEKLVALRFPEVCPPTLVSGRIAELLEFQASLGGEMIVKPLDGAGGEGIFHLRSGDRNTKAILETATHAEGRMIMAQQYIPEIREGDKRVILVEGEAKGAVLRVPHESEARANFHVGGRAHQTTLTPRDLEICDTVGPTLREMGIVFAGVDIIGDWMTEINVTSPTGIREIYDLDGIRIEVDVLDAVEARLTAVPTQSRR